MKKSGKILKSICFLLICMLFMACGAKESSQYISQAINSIKLTDYTQAIDYLNKAEEKGEDKMQLYRAYGIAYMGMTEYDKAVEALETALACSSGKITEYEYDINYYLATAYYKVGRYADAVSIYTAILDLRPKEKQAYYLRGMALLELNNYNEAVKDFDKTIALDKTDYSVYIDVYTLLSKKGYEAEGRGYLEKVMEKENSSMSSYDKGRICYYMGDYANACVYLEQAYKKDESEEVMLFLGRAYDKNGNLNYASSIYTKYLQENPESAVVYNELGLCKLKQGEYQGALDAFQQALKIEDNDMRQVLLFNEIVAYEHIGEFRRATILLENYLAIYPDDEEAQREYTFLKSR